MKRVSLRGVPVGIVSNLRLRLNQLGIDYSVNVNSYRSKYYSITLPTDKALALENWLKNKGYTS